MGRQKDPCLRYRQTAAQHSSAAAPGAAAACSKEPALALLPAATPRQRGAPEGGVVAGHAALRAHVHVDLYRLRGVGVLRLHEPAAGGAAGAGRGGVGWGRARTACRAGLGASRARPAAWAGRTRPGAAAGSQQRGGGPRSRQRRRRPSQEVGRQLGSPSGRQAGRQAQPTPRAPRRVGADGDGRQVEGAQPPPYLCKHRGIAGVARKPEGAARAQHRPAAPQRRLAAQRRAHGPVLRRGQRHPAGRVLTGRAGRESGRQRASKGRTRRHEGVGGGWCAPAQAVQENARWRRRRHTWCHGQAARAPGAARRGPRWRLLPPPRPRPAPAPHLTLVPGWCSSCHQSASTTLVTPRRVNQLPSPSGTYLPGWRGRVEGPGGDGWKSNQAAARLRPRALRRPAARPACPPTPQGAGARSTAGRRPAPGRPLTSAAGRRSVAGARARCPCPGGLRAGQEGQAAGQLGAGGSVCLCE